MWPSFYLYLQVFSSITASTDNESYIQYVCQCVHIIKHCPVWSYHWLKDQWTVEDYTDRSVMVWPDEDDCNFKVSRCIVSVLLMLVNYVISAVYTY